MNAVTRRIKKVTKVQPEIIRQALGPTLERLAKTNGFYSIGDDQQGGHVYTIRDAPLERMWSRKALAGPEYAALQKYKHHWYHGGLECAVGSADLNRIFANDPGSMSGMARTEKQVHHRKQYREAREMLGHRTGIVVDNVVCAEQELVLAGYSIGWNNKSQAIAAATEMLRDAGYRLAKHWGIG